MKDIFERNADRLFPRDNKARCLLHGKECRIHSKDKTGRFMINVAGTVCVHWPPFGTGSGLAGNSTLPCLCWLYEQRARKVPWLLHECTPRFPPTLIKEVLGKEYDVTSIVCGPETLGIPNDRMRRFTLSIRSHLCFGFGFCGESERERMS